jgi:hypothetical protein
MRSAVTCILFALLFVGCGSPCDGALVQGNDNCAPGCEGVSIGYVSCDRTTGHWCHETTNSRETVVCLVEEATGVAFFVANPDVTLPGFRECTAEEREPVACATAAASESQ